MKNTKKSLRINAMIALMATALAFASVPLAASGHETTPCTFTLSGMTMLLDGDCSTNTTIDVPDGFTLDGQGHTITAVDNPAHGTFIGAVVRNELGAAEMHVVDLVITTDNLGNVCKGGDDRLRGIMFRSASGSVENVTVTDIRKSGDSGCQEGNAIEISNPPFSFAPAPHTAVGHPDTKHVLVLSSTVERYQKTGILANGDVEAVIMNNKVVGLGPIDYIGQNGLQLGFGATGVLEGNDVSANDYTPNSTFSAGILLFLSGTTIYDNLVRDNEVGISTNFANGTIIEKNHVFDSRTNGIHLVGSTNMTVLDNQVLRSGTDGIYMAGGTNPFSSIHHMATTNAIEANWVQDSGVNGIVNNEDSENNTYMNNTLQGSGVLSCLDTSTGTGTNGTANLWVGNTAEAPSDPEGICVKGLPVDDPPVDDPPVDDPPVDDPPVKECLTDFTAMALADTTIKLSWMAIDGADQIRIYRAEGNGPMVLVQSFGPGAGEYVDTDTVLHVTYTYELRPVVAGHELDDCERIAVTSIPVFPGLMGVALAIGAGTLGYAGILRRRR